MLQVLHSLSAKAVSPAHSFSVSMELDFKCVDLPHDDIEFSLQIWYTDLPHLSFFFC